MRVFFDDDCGLCTRAVGWCASRAPEVVFVPAASSAASIAVVTADGREFRSVSAVGVLLSACGRGPAFLGAVLRFSLFRPFFALLYLLVSRNRRRISKLLGWDACPVPSAGSGPDENIEVSTEGPVSSPRSRL